MDEGGRVQVHAGAAPGRARFDGGGGEVARISGDSLNSRNSESIRRVGPAAALTRATGEIAMNRSAHCSMAALCACAAVAVSNAYAQQHPAAAKAVSRISTGDVLSKLNRCATVSFSESRLEDVLTWIREAAGIK